MATAGEADSRRAAETKVAAPLRQFVAKLPAKFAELTELTDLSPEQISLSDIARRAKGDKLHPWCGWCGSGSDTWICELRRTPYRTIEEARPELEQLEAEQMLSRALWDALLGTSARPN